jgi:hypothetical protein
MDQFVRVFAGFYSSYFSKFNDIGIPARCGVQESEMEWVLAWKIGWIDPDYHIWLAISGRSLGTSPEVGSCFSINSQSNHSVFFANSIYT